MPETRSPWRRAFNGPLLGLAGLLAVAGIVVLVVLDSNAGVGVGSGLLGLALVVLIAGFFLAIGYGEDDDRAREERLRRTGA